MSRILALSLSGLLFFQTASHAEYRPNIVDLVTETQKQSLEDDELTLVWWMPRAFWQISLEADGTMPLSAISEVMSHIEPYIVVAVVDGTVGPFGGGNFKSEKEVQAEIRIVDGAGNGYGPLATDEVSTDVQNLIGAMKPVIANMIGQMGQNMNFFLFSSRGADGTAIVDALEEGTFAVALGERSFEWRLPLSALLPPKLCPIGQRELDGAWKYCPWHGNELDASEVESAEVAPVGEAAPGEGASMSRKELKKQKKKKRSGADS